MDQQIPVLLGQSVCSWGFMAQTQRGRSDTHTCQVLSGSFPTSNSRPAREVLEPPFLQRWGLRFGGIG